MGYLVDSHCHLHDREFFLTEQAEKMLGRAHENNVQKIICVGTDAEDSLKARDFASQHQGVYWTYGVHPENANTSGQLGYGFLRASGGCCRGVRGPSPMKTGARNPVPKKAVPQLPPIAIGEVGLDYHSDGYNREAQIKLFEEMLQLAIDNDLPVSFHVREAFDDFFAVVANFPQVRGVVHSFTDSKKVLRRILETTDFYVGVNGLATYSTLPTPPLERILLETDAPFLTPVPFRGIINEPAYIRNIAAWLSEKLGVEFEIIERETSKNAEKLFRFPDSVICA